MSAREAFIFHFRRDSETLIVVRGVIAISVMLKGTFSASFASTAYVCLGSSGCSEGVELRFAILFEFFLESSIMPAVVLIQSTAHII